MKNKKVLSFAIFIAVMFTIVCTLPTAFADYSVSNNGATVTDASANQFTQLAVNKQVYSIKKSKIPKKYKQYENYTFQVAKGSKLKYRVTVNPNGDGLLSNLNGTKVKSAKIDFGDGTKKSSSGWISHTYKKKGWYKITLTLNEATFSKFYNGIFGANVTKGNGVIRNGTVTYLFYVADKPQLGLSKIQSGFTSQKAYNKGTIGFLDVTVKNLGSKKSKATKITAWYQKPNSYGKVYSKLKKYTKSAKLKALKAGQSTTVRLYFKIPKKYSKLVKNIRLGTKKFSQLSTENAMYAFT